MLTASRRLGRSRRTAILAFVTAGAVVAAGFAGERAVAVSGPAVAFLSFAVANSYDAPMLKAAKDVAKKSGAT